MDIKNEEQLLDGSFHRELTGVILTVPEEIDGLSKSTVHCMIVDRNKQKWRVCAHNSIATSLVKLSVGEKIKLVGTAKHLSTGAYFKAKRQITPISIKVT